MKSNAEIAVYGVHFAPSQFRSDYYRVLAEMFSEVQKENFKKFEDEYMRLNPFSQHDEVLKVYVDEYESPAGFYAGVTACIKDAINQNEFTGYQWIDADVNFGECQIFVYPYIPATRAFLITVEEIDALMRKYIAPLLKAPVEAVWFLLCME